MTPFSSLTAVALPLLRINMDTDIIIPSREMKKVSKKGLGEGLFAGLRYQGTSGRQINPDFILNQAAYGNAAILLGGANFGCGSSREHAVWALMEYGFRAIIAPSFGSIFYNNAVHNGLLPVELVPEDIGKLADWVSQEPQKNKLTIDLEKQIITGPGVFDFTLAAQDRKMLLNGYDMIDMTLLRVAEIAAFEKQDQMARPWAGLTRGRSQLI